MFFFIPTLGKMNPFWLYNTFQLGWFNHQLAMYIKLHVSSKATMHLVKLPRDLTQPHPSKVAQEGIFVWNPLISGKSRLYRNYLTNTAFDDAVTNVMQTFYPATAHGEGLRQMFDGFRSAWARPTLSGEKIFLGELVAEDGDGWLARIGWLSA